RPRAARARGTDPRARAATPPAARGGTATLGTTRSRARTRGEGGTKGRSGRSVPMPEQWAVPEEPEASGGLEQAWRHRSWPANERRKHRAWSRREPRSKRFEGLRRVLGPLAPFAHDTMSSVPDVTCRGVRSRATGTRERIGGSRRALRARLRLFGLGAAPR